MSRLLNKTLYVRTLSGIALLIVVLGTVLWSPYSMLALGVFLTAGIMREFYRIGRLTGARPLTTYPIVVGAAIVVLAFLIKTGTLAPVCLAAALPAVFVLFIAELYRKQPSPLTNIAWEIAGIVYAAVPMALFVTLPVAVRGAAIDYSPAVLLSILFIVWANDVGAYLFGVAFGRRKLFERISPNKSWEGFFGGVACAVGVGMLVALWQDASVPAWAGAGGIVAVTGVFGDLVESMFKRSVGIKDSGNILPGHGGFLDRFAALILALPFVYTYFSIIFTL